MVGNIIDSKKKIAMSEYTEIMPGAVITTTHKIILMKAYKASNLFGLIIFISAVPANLPSVNNTRLAESK
jgi:hypothetical protein